MTDSKTEFEQRPIDEQELIEKLLKSWEPRIVESLNLFIMHVKIGSNPPDWLMQFMADGAREFLLGGKPWQKGAGGRPAKPYGPDEIKSYLLRYYGGLSYPRIVGALGLLYENGRDKSQTVSKDAERGKLAFCMAKIRQVEMLKGLFSELLELDFENLTNGQRCKCKEGLRRGLADLELDDQKPNYA